MATRRMISNSLSTSKKMKRLEMRLKDKPNLLGYGLVLFPLLVSHTDDHGHLSGDSFTLKYKLVPTFDVSEEEVEEIIEIMSEIGLIDIYEVKGNRYIEVVNFGKYQEGRNYIKQGEYPDKFGKIPDGCKVSTTKKNSSDNSKNSGKFQKVQKIPESSGNSGKFKNIPVEQKQTEQNRKEQKTKENKQTEQKQISISAAVASFASALGKGNCSVSAAAPPRAIASELVKLGISLEKTQELVSRYPEEVIRNQIDWLPYRQFRKPVAGLIAAIEQNYEMPVIPQSEEQRAELEHLEKVKRCAKKYPDCAKIGQKLCQQCPNVLKKKAEMQEGHT